MQNFLHSQVRGHKLIQFNFFSTQNDRTNILYYLIIDSIVTILFDYIFYLKFFNFILLFIIILQIYFNFIIFLNLIRIQKESSEREEQNCQLNEKSCHIEMKEEDVYVKIMP